MRKSAFGIYMLWKDGEIQEMVEEIEKYGCAFWTDIQFFLLDHVNDPSQRFFILSGIIIAYEYRKAR